MYLPKKMYCQKKHIPTIYTNDKGIILAAIVEKMRKDLSKEIYAKRKIIVEPVFGQIKTNSFRHFSLGGGCQSGRRVFSYLYCSKL